MVSKAELESLRAQVRARQRAANNKVSRLKSNGIDVGGTSFDVRRDLANTKRYTATQLKSYLGQLNNFVSRNNGFVAGDSRTPIPIAEWRAYKREESRYNRTGEREQSRVGDIFLPSAGMNIRERKTMLGKSARGGAVNSPYQNINRKPSGITGVEALHRLTEQMQKRNKKDFLPGELKTARKELNGMLKEIGNHEFLERANALSDDQFNILWNYTDFATEISRDYEIMKARATGRKERAHEKVHEDNTIAIGELISWAEILPKKGRGK